MSEACAYCSDGKNKNQSERRKNGFERPWDALQICTWCLYPLILVDYYAFVYFLLWDILEAKVILTILFTIFAVATAVAVGITCTIDPADDALCGVSTIPQTSTNDQIYCHLCEVHVHNSSKHCRFCEKCVVRFDHHCKWLNTCIGKKNYHAFLGIVLSVFLLTSELLALSIALMVESFAYPSDFEHRVIHVNEFTRFLGSPITIIGLESILVISVAVLCGLVAMLIQLGGFHIMLLWRGLTTYDFIVQEQKRLRDQDAERMRKQMEKQQQQSKSDRIILSQARNATDIQTVRPVESQNEISLPNHDQIAASEENQIHSSSIELVASRGEEKV
jgi:hypothetical protein